MRNGSLGEDRLVRLDPFDQVADALAGAYPGLPAEAAACTGAVADEVEQVAVPAILESNFRFGTDDLLDDVDAFEKRDGLPAFAAHVVYTGNRILVEGMKGFREVRGVEDVPHLLAGSVDR